MSIVEFEGPPSSSFDESETGETSKSFDESKTGESIKWPWVRSGGGVNSVGVTERKQTDALHHPYPRAFCTLPSFTRIKRPR